MTLQDWLARSGMDQKRFAAMVGTSDATISRILRTPQAPRLALALRIERATRGAVKVADLVGGQGNA